MIWSVTPDMLVAAIVYLAGGIILRVQSGAGTRQTFALLGIVLGLGYLAKAAMFPMAFVFLGVSLFSVSTWRRALSLGLTGILFFLLIGGPFIAALSNAKGRFTFGDAGKLMYAWHVNGIPYPHWQGEVPGGGIPEHPTRKILDHPPIYEFGEPIGGTYPVSYDPTYWYEGVIPHFELKGQFRVLWLSAQYYFDIFFRQLGGLFIGFIILFAFGRRRKLRVADIIPLWGPVLVALAALGMFALVHVQSRYIGAFVVLLLAGLLANVHLPDTQTSERLINVVSPAMISIIAINILAFNLVGFRKLTGITDPSQLPKQQARLPSWPGEVAEALQQFDIEPGDKVAVIGYAFDSFWARLAHVQIVAEMLGWQADDFWLGDPANQSEVIQAFESTGAAAVVAERVPSYATLKGWHRVGDSNYYVYILTK
jgi:4-amino-4-deoxy-L-arabinose transferase-like glycosyltransferase